MHQINPVHQKAFRFVFAIIMASLLASLSGCFGEDDPLAGMWQGTNYQCPTGIAFREQVKVSVDEGVYTAVKVTGDACVPAGEVTFHGTRENITCITGEPDDPVNGEYQSELVQIDKDTFQTCTVRFVRMKEIN